MVTREDRAKLTNRSLCHSFLSFTPPAARAIGQSDTATAVTTVTTATAATAVITAIVAKAAKAAKTVKTKTATMAAPVATGAMVVRDIPLYYTRFTPLIHLLLPYLHLVYYVHLTHLY